VTALIVGAAIAVAALVYVLFPLFDAVVPARHLTTGPALAPESAIDALREIEFDRATGKLSDDDYSSLKAEYTRTALVEMRVARQTVADSAETARPGDSVAGAPNGMATDQSMDAAEAAVLRYRSVRRSCATCGPRPEPDPAFCSSCGTYLKEACVHCGAAVDAPASRFCANCGGSLAA
jgi:hypothetical protein